MNDTDATFSGASGPSGRALQRLGVLNRWWRMRVIGDVDHQAVIDKVSADSGWTSHYLFMTLISAGIAVLGLLLSSPAVVIGAMLVSPLMGPIIGLGFALAAFDYPDMVRSLRALLFGSLLAILFAAVIVLMSPLQAITPEIVARTRPNLFDLVVAILSALAGSYAMIRGREGAIVGVAIATALMPPLATVGFGLATLNGTVFGGALLLFITNLMAIALTASVMARLYGFGSALSPDKTRMQMALVLVVFLALALPLGLTLRTIAWEALVARQARGAIVGQFAGGARASDITVDYAAEPLRVSAVVFTPAYVADAGAKAQTALSRVIGRPARIEIDQVRIGAASAERAQLEAAEASAAARRDADTLATQLALVAGADPQAVTVDRDHRRATVQAGALPGATLASYRALEARVAALQPGWTIMLRPPLLPLPAMALGKDGTPDPQAIALTTWASQRVGIGIRITGPDKATAAVAAALSAAGVKAPLATAAGRDLTVAWDIPTSAYPD